jgi:hypothetical protein
MGSGMSMSVPESQKLGFHGNSVEEAKVALKVIED